MGLLDSWEQLKGYIQANTPRNTRPAVSPGKVFSEGLLNPNPYNAVAANRFKDSAFGLLGIVPGLGDASSAVESADLFKRGENFAGGMAALGALPLVPAIGGIFVGKGAKTWDFLKAQQADELLKQGVDPREVWKQTGTLKGVDGALRQEIPDNLADIEKSHPMAWLTEMSPMGKDMPLEQAQALGQKYNDAVDQVNMFGSGNGVMESMLLHRGLYDAYPDLRTTRLSFDKMGSAYGGSFDEAANKVSLARGNLGNATEGKSTTLHELQHAIQQREGWATGGAPDMAFRDARMWGKDGAEGSDVAQRMLADKMRELSTPMPIKDYAKQAWQSDVVTPEIVADYANYAKSTKQNAAKFGTEAQKTVAHDWYKRLAGEAEARLTQSRMGLDAAQRLQHYPYDMGQYGLDVPMDQLIVRGLLGQ